MEQEPQQGPSLLNSEGPEFRCTGALEGWELPENPSRLPKAPLKAWLTPGPLAGMPELCRCSLLWFWEGLGAGLSHVQLQQGFPHPQQQQEGLSPLALAAQGGQLQPGRSSPQSPAAPRRVRAGTAGTAPAGLCRGCPSLCCSSRSPETSSRAVFAFERGTERAGRARSGARAGPAGARGRMCP